ncbi:hypothetical protein [Nannocystis punicea]|uniref:Beta-lactamase n=1 Tax=Nannocystis punicea TaxID=2995304 RepID=A0ABY7GXU2_9BACT|nr:hypothetical protein [Nannocystis poenicansa]WAS91798.1 hypothetical protein O0S08_36915 [Nannocystis poenicansa]
MPKSVLLFTASLLLVSLACRRSEVVAPVPASEAATTEASAPVASPMQAEPVATKEPDCSPATIDRGAEGWRDGAACVERLVPRCEQGDPEACIGAATIMLNGSGGAAQDPARALAVAAGACERGNSVGCLIAAVVHDKGLGVAVDPAAATAFIDKACALGDAQGCQAKAARAPRSPAFIAEANLTVGSIAADGLELRDLMCDVTGGMPMLGALVIAGSLAKQRRALDKCAPAGQAFAATWTFADGKTRDVAASGGSPAANACVEKALARAVATLDGRCGAIVLVGKLAGAEATVEAVRSGAAK